MSEKRTWKPGDPPLTDGVWEDAGNHRWYLHCAAGGWVWSKSPTWHSRAVRALWSSFRDAARVADGPLEEYLP